MNKTIINILKFIGEVILATAVWTLLDYITKEPLNILSNLIDVTIIVVLCNLTDYIVKKIKRKNKN